MSDRNPLVSVVIPSYNRAHLLPQCLDSVLQQTHRSVEALVVDDGSRDNTADVMRDYCRRDSRLKYLPRENGGVSAARNTGLRAAQGDFIALLDSDDAWHPWKIEAQLRAFAMLPPDVGMIWSDMTAIDPNGRVLHDRFLHRMYGAYAQLQGRRIFESSSELPLPCVTENDRPASLHHGNIYSWMLYGNLVHTSTTLLRRERAEQVGGFEESLRCGEDYLYHLTTCRLGPVAFLDVPTILYRIGCDDQITAPRNQIPFARAFIATLRNEFRDHPELIQLTSEEKQSIFSEAYLWLGTALRNGGDRQQACRQFVQALSCRPGNRQAWKELARTLAPQILQDAWRRKKAARRTPREEAPSAQEVAVSA